MMELAGLDSRNTRTGGMAILGALLMLALGFAAVPLYDMFCRVTGFGGTTQRASVNAADSAAVKAQGLGAGQISIRFDASTAADMPWTFAPEQVTDNVQIGERDMAFYIARNDANVPITGTASFNVSPARAGAYFNKIQCFCFTQQRLEPGQEMRMPVLYFIDPAILEDETTRDLEQITLSYSFHKAADPAS